MAATGARERERDWRVMEKWSKWEKTKIYRGIFANICHCGNTWHATWAWDACVADLGPQMKHLIWFRDPYA